MLIRRGARPGTTERAVIVVLPMTYYIRINCNNQNSKMFIEKNTHYVFRIKLVENPVI